MWVPKGKRPIVTVTGSHRKTCVFGTLTVDYYMESDHLHLPQERQIP